MTKLLELREMIRSIYYQYDRIFRAAGKFLLAFGVFFTIIYQIGYGINVQMPLIAVGLAVICAWLPAGAISLFMCGLITVKLWSISMEAGAVAAILFMLMLLLYFIFRPRNTVLMAAAMLACTFNISGILPIATGLLFGPLALIPQCLGVISSYIIYVVKTNYSILAAQNERLTSIEKVTYFIDNLIHNERMLLILSAFALTFLVVYWIRRRPYSYAWSVAIPSGLTVFVLTMMAGNVLFDVSVRVPALIVSCVAGVLGAIAVTVFSFLLDGSRSEYLEYEDEEYYYFVKAIPKVSVTAPDKRITRITGQRGSRKADEPQDQVWEEQVFEQEAGNAAFETESEEADKEAAGGSPEDSGSVSREPAERFRERDE